MPGDLLPREVTTDGATGEPIRTPLLRDLPAPSGPPGPGHAPIPFGLLDLPAIQRQQAAAIDLDTFGHLMAAGAPRSGRSQLLRTIAAAIAACCSCADAHLYGPDCGNGALLPLADLPHCGVARGGRRRSVAPVTAGADHG